MSEVNKSSLMENLSKLNCHFTWDLFNSGNIPSDLEDQLNYDIENSNTEISASMCNLMAYVKQLKGLNKDALEYLQRAEELIQQDTTDQAKITRLVNWGNHAWVYYQLNKLSEAQTYIDKVKQECDRLEIPEMYSEKGWALLKSGESQTARAKKCFEEALGEKPNHPQFTCGLAVASFYLEQDSPSKEFIDLLQQAIELNSDDSYLNVLLARALQRRNQDREMLVNKVLKRIPRKANVLKQAARFYQDKGDLDRAIELFEEVLQLMPNNAKIHKSIGCICWKKVREIQNGQQSRDRRGQGENCEKSELVRRAIDNFKRVIDINESITQVCIYLGNIYAQEGQYEEAEYYFQKECSKALADTDKQNFHLNYGNFQLYHRGRVNEAIHHFKEGVRIKQDSDNRKNMKRKLQNIAQKMLKDGKRSEASDILSFLHEQE